MGICKQPYPSDPTAHDVTQWALPSLWEHSTQLISVEYCNGKVLALMLGINLTVTSIGVCDGGECFTLLRLKNM